LPVFQRLHSLENSLPSDLRREWFAWQQYGQGVAIAFAALLVWSLAPAQRRRLFDLALAVVIAEAVSNAGKMLLSRPRPRPELMDPRTIPGPWGVYPIEVGGQWKLLHGWERGAGPDLWSLPSS